jgi:4-hydroxy-tetrahydrodipicolinate synthase
MQTLHPLSGIYAAAVTPLRPDSSLDLPSLPALLSFFARRGCHGALLLGTTGEGPSFSPRERLAIFQAALEVRQDFPEFRLLAGTGTPSLDETIELTRSALELGFNGTVVLPPYYFRSVSDEGLFTWYHLILQQAVPSGTSLLGYHIPKVSGVPLSEDLLSRLKDAFPERFAGLKDSSGEPEHAERLGKVFGKDLLVLNGSDDLFSLALQNGASGCITALANLFSADLRQIWDAHGKDETGTVAQERLNQARQVLKGFQPAAALLKPLLARWHDFPRWSVRPPLLPFSAEVEEKAAAAMSPLRYV